MNTQVVSHVPNPPYHYAQNVASTPILYNGGAGCGQNFAPGTILDRFLRKRNGVMDNNTFKQKNSVTTAIEILSQNKIHIKRPKKSNKNMKLTKP